MGDNHVRRAQKPVFQHIPLADNAQNGAFRLVGGFPLKSFLRGEERSVILHFNCDGIIIDKI